MVGAKSGTAVVFSFEDGVPINFGTSDNSRLSVSTNHFKDGKYSLRWDYQTNGNIKVKSPIGYTPFQEHSVSQARDTFSVWVYNEKPMDNEVVFEFGRGDKIDCWFTFGLDFKGWRTAWIMFERDMQGQPHPEMDTMTIKAPQHVKSGTLYFDQIILSNSISPRHHTRDFQVPFVNVEADYKVGSHWVSLYYFSQLRPNIPFRDEVTEQDIAVFQTINERYEAYALQKQEICEQDMEKLRNQFQAYNIVQNEQGLTGYSVDVIHYYEIYPRYMKERLKSLSNSMDMQAASEYLLNIAQKYHSTDNPFYKEELKEIFIVLTNHLDDEGWAEGSSQGTVHHLGYCMRCYYPAMFLMRDVLREAGILARTQRTMAWFSGANRIFNQDSTVKESNMDVYNTLLQGMLASILLMDDSVEKICYLESYSKWISRCLMPAPGLLGPFKVDGCTFHHCNQYAAYGLGGLEGITPVMYFLSGTPYRITAKTHEIVKKAVMSMRLYCNKYEWLVSMSSRHPKGEGEHCELQIAPFKYMALAGTPDGKQEFDMEVAAAYLRLLENGQTDALDERLKRTGIIPESDPNGHWTMNYGALSIHRRDGWLVGARGHSRYLWANETYVKNNLYGRYITHGQIQIMGCGNPVNNRESGFVQEGWDWNSWPGTTTVHLPIEKLKSDVKNLDTHSGFEEMLLSDETYTGGLNLQNENGMFAMKLHEHPKYEGSHRARKSVFFFDNRVICLGSNIENENTNYPTRTTLFQNHIKEPDEPMYLNSDEKIIGLDYNQSLEADEAIWMLDNKGNGYYVPAGQNITVSRSLQHSKAQDTCEDTQGTFTKAFIEHGKAPKDAEYEYMILVKSDKDSIRNIKENMENKDSEVYTVMQKDYNAHIVKDHATNITGYALFEADVNFNNDLVVVVDTPCMVMTKQMEEDLILSVCDPDLRLYEGIEENQYDEKGNRNEVSVYSRTWKYNPSKIHTVTLKIKGNWTVTGKYNNCRIINTSDGITTLTFDCIDAMKIEVNLRRLS